MSQLVITNCYYRIYLLVVNKKLSIYKTRRETDDNVYFFFFTLFHFTMFTKVTTDYLILWKQTDKEQPNLPSDKWSQWRRVQRLSLQQSLDTTWEV